jgi:hypothetical protein
MAMDNVKKAMIAIGVVITLALVGLGIWGLVVLIKRAQLKAAAQDVLDKLNGANIGPERGAGMGMGMGMGAPSVFQTNGTSIGLPLSSGGCINENMVGIPIAPEDARAGTSQGCAFDSRPVSSKPVPLASARLSNSATGGVSHGMMGKSVSVNLAPYARGGNLDPASFGAAGVDSQEELLLASALIGGQEMPRNTVLDIFGDPRGEAAGAWKPMYVTNPMGQLEPGYGGYISELGPYALGQRGGAGTF